MIYNIGGLQTAVLEVSMSQQLYRPVDCWARSIRSSHLAVGKQKETEWFHSGIESVILSFGFLLRNDINKYLVFYRKQWDW